MQWLALAAAECVCLARLRDRQLAHLAPPKEVLVSALGELGASWVLRWQHSQDPTPQEEAIALPLAHDSARGAS